MYHVELRQFPHNLCRFNLAEEELHVLVEPWSREQPVEFGERRWSPHQARLTIVEGPQIPMEQLTMGRGWRTAQRQGEDVTDRVLAAAAASQGAATSVPPKDGSPDTGLLADSLGLELLALLEDHPVPLTRAWQLALARCPELPASECLALAERAVRSLLRSRLIVLLGPVAGADEGGAEVGGAQAEVGEGELEPVLRAVESWTEQGESAGALIRRA
jgi:hypothetical protein